MTYEGFCSVIKVPCTNLYLLKSCKAADADGPDDEGSNVSLEFEKSLLQ